MLCAACRIGDDAEGNEILLCDGCDSAYHQLCTTPPTLLIPDGDWFCERCTAMMTRVEEAVSDSAEAPEPAPAPEPALEPAPAPAPGPAPAPAPVSGPDLCVNAWIVDAPAPAPAHAPAPAATPAATPASALVPSYAQGSASAYSYVFGPRRSTATASSLATSQRIPDGRLPARRIAAQELANLISRLIAEERIQDAAVCTNALFTLQELMQAYAERR